MPHPVLLVGAAAGLGVLVELAITPVAEHAGPALFLATMGVALLVASRRSRTSMTAPAASESRATPAAPAVRADVVAGAATHAVAHAVAHGADEPAAGARATESTKLRVG